jgi:hypothetical protein
MLSIMTTIARAQSVLADVIAAAKDDLTRDPAKDPVLHQEQLIRLDALHTALTILHNYQELFQAVDNLLDIRG